MLNLKEIRIGERYMNHWGNWYVIIDYDGNKNVTVQFEESGFIRYNVSYQNVRLGNVSSPFDKTQCGVGCIGLMSDGSYPVCKVNGELTKEYKVWCSMINRCYNEKQLQHNPTYRNCSVDDFILVFANFLENIDKLPNHDIWLVDDNYELDKDTLQPGVENKVYSLDTIMFIPKEENSRESINRVHERRIKVKKEKVVKPKKVIRVTNIKTGEFKDYQRQEEVANVLNVSQSYVSRLISNNEIYNGYKIEKVYVPVSNN